MEEFKIFVFEMAVYLFTFWSHLVKTMSNKSVNKLGLACASGSCCNPSYSGGRDLGDCNSKPTRAEDSKRPNLEQTQHKKGLWRG
jgi:hypothetical protein